MKKLKKYSQKELEDLMCKYNRLVVIHSRKTPMQFNELIKEFDFDEASDKPTISIPGFDSRTGKNEYLKLEWRK